MTLLYHTPLDADAQREFGIAEPQPFAMADEVRFGELDMLGHVNNAVYMVWFERVRVRYSKAWGVSTYADDPSNPRIVIRSGEIHYRAEMLLDEPYVVTCRCTSFRTTSYAAHQQLWAGGTLRATFDCVMVTLARDGSGKRPLPEALKTRFREVDGAHPA